MKTEKKGNKNNWRAKKNGKLHTENARTVNMCFCVLNGLSTVQIEYENALYPHLRLDRQSYRPL